MVPIPQFPTWAAFNAWLEEQSRKRQRDGLRGESETIEERLQRDLAAMRPLPASPFDACDQAIAKVKPQPLVRYKSSSVKKTIRRIVFGEERLLCPGRLWLSRCLGPGLCRRSGERLPASLREG